MTGIVAKCIADLTTKVQSIEALSLKTFTIYDEEELFDNTKLLKPPAVGILYEGMRKGTPNPDQSKDTHKIGLTCDVVIAIVLLHKIDNLSQKIDTKVPSVDLLDAIRDKIKNTRSPSMHFWQFLVEAPAIIKHGNVVWIQRWSCPVQLV